MRKTGEEANHLPRGPLLGLQDRVPGLSTSLAALADEMSVMMWARESGSEVIHVNQAVLESTGWRAQDFTLPKWRAAIHPDDVKAYWQVYSQATRARRKFTIEYRYRHASGQYRWLLDCGVPRYDADGRFAGYAGVALDIQERKEAERERLELAGRMLQAQEEERSRIARELHDDIAQRLALLAIRLQQLERDPLGPRTSQGLVELRKQAKQLSLDVSRISHLLHSSYLENLGLAAAVKNQCEEIARAHGLEIRCQVGELPPEVDRNVALGLFRVLQEALRNALRHSRARCVEVELSGKGAGICLRVADDGVGFDPAAIKVSEGLGLMSMRERLRLVGGALTISSRPSGGTRIEAHVPQATAEPINVVRAPVLEWRRAG